MQVQRVDVLVAGGGPAGLAAAETAASAGCRTLLVERGAEIGGPVRTSGASWYADLRDLDIPDHLAHPLAEIRFVAPGNRTPAWRYKTPLACVLDVRGVWQHLAARAAAAGAEIRLRTTATDPLVEDNQVVGTRLRDRRGRTTTVRAVVTIDATGVSAILATRAGLHPPFHRQGIGAEVDLYAPHYDQHVGMLLVGRQVAPRGYAWAFPHGDHRVRVGVGVIRPDADLDPQALLQRLLHHPALVDPLQGSTPIEQHTGAIPSEALVNRLSTAGLLLAGDSAAQASPLVGEGIRYAIRAGRLAGETAAVAAQEGDSSAARLAHYDRQWRRQFGAEMRLAFWLNRRLSRYGDRNWRVVAALLACLSPTQVARGLHGDFDRRWWTGLALRSPRLVLAAWRALEH